LQGLNVALKLGNLGLPGLDGVGNLAQCIVSVARRARSRFKNCYKRVSDEVDCVYMLLLATSGLD